MPAANEKFDIGVVVSFGYLIPRRIIEAFRLPPVNVHPSLLPQYRGPAPIHQTIINGDRETGVSIIELHPTQFDAGRILKQLRFPIPFEDPDYQTLEPFLARIGGRELVTVLRDYEYYSNNALRQDSTGKDSAQLMRAPKLTKQNGDHLIDWSVVGAWEVYRKHRAVYHQFNLQCKQFAGRPDVRLISLRSPLETGSELLLLQSTGRLDSASAQPGDLFYNQITGTLFVRTGAAYNYNNNNIGNEICYDDTDATEYKMAANQLGDAWLGVREVQLEGRDPVKVSAFLSRSL